MSDPIGGTRGQTPEDVRHLPQAPRPEFSPGDAIPNLSSWLLERKLGGGGFGEVWLVRHAWNASEQPRAVKFCTEPEARHRLVTHEKNVVLRVMKYASGHPNIVPLLECNLDGDIPWLMYEFVEGGTLASLIEQWRELPLPKRLGRAARTLYAIAGALAKCHRFDPPLVHRDMKPQNVLMAGGKVPRIIDFGIGGIAVQKDSPTTGGLTAFAARVPTHLQASGTRLYAPPEQMFGSVPHPRDDVYALGIIAYQMLAGDLTIGPGPDAELELRDLRVPVELASLIVRSVAMNPERRPRDATEWEATLAELIKKAQNLSSSSDTSVSGSKAVLLSEPDPTEPEPDPGPPPVPVPPASARRGSPNRWTDRVIVGIVLLLGLGLTAVLLTRGPRKEPEAPPAEPQTPKGETPAPKAITPPAAIPDPKSKAVPRAGEARDIEIAPGVKMTFCWVPAGEAQLGSPKAERDAVLNNPKNPKPAGWLDSEAEEVRGRYKTSGFWMGKYEVTQAEWAAVMRGTTVATPSFYRTGNKALTNPVAAKALAAVPDTSRFPVDSVSWDDCQEFLTRATAHGGIPKALGESGAFALPHEDQWEYACRGGWSNQQPFYWGKTMDGMHAHFHGSYPPGSLIKGPPTMKLPAEVGSYAARFPHPWGLCDMHGNVWEWCDNTYDKTANRVLRGGAWGSRPYDFDPDNDCRAAYRLKTAPPAARLDKVGFRVIIREAP